MKTPFLLRSAAAFSLLVASADAQQVGAGNTIPNDELDSSGGRINIDTSTPLTLAPGTYTASLFNFDAGTVGDVTPFLATLTSDNLYQAIAVGDDLAVTGLNTDASAPFGGSAIFTLTATTTVYAGIASDTQNPIFLDNNTSPFTDHEGGGQPASSYVVTLGGQVPPDGNFSNPDLGRTYAFSVTVVPEPTTLAGVLVVGAALGLRRRRV